MQHRTSLEADLRAIEAINQQDMQFALANDSDKMMSQWADDIVLPSAGLGRSCVGAKRSPKAFGEWRVLK